MNIYREREKEREWKRVGEGKKKREKLMYIRAYLWSIS